MARKRSESKKEEAGSKKSTKLIVNKNQTKIELVYGDECYVLMPGERKEVPYYMYIPKGIKVSVIG